MSSNILQSAVFFAMAAVGTVAMAQTNGGASPSTGSLSGNLAGSGADFAGGHAAGANTKANGGLTRSIDKAMGGNGGEQPRDPQAGCGKLKCD